MVITRVYRKKGEKKDEGRKKGPFVKRPSEKKALSKKKAGEGRRKITPFTKKKCAKKVHTFFFVFTKIITNSEGERKKTFFKKKREKGLPQKSRGQKRGRKKALCLFLRAQKIVFYTHY